MKKPLEINVHENVIVSEFVDAARFYKKHFKVLLLVIVIMMILPITGYWLGGILGAIIGGSACNLVVFLLGVGLCFVPALGHGEVEEWIQEVEVSGMDLALLRAEVRYIMHNPTSFLNVELFYDPDGRFRFWFPEGLDTKQKICARVQDTRGIFSNKSTVALREEFQEQLETICGAMRSWFTDMDTDVVAMFYSGTMDSLGYFYQGEYHLWEE